MSRLSLGWFSMKWRPLDVFVDSIFGIEIIQQMFLARVNHKEHKLITSLPHIWSCYLRLSLISLILKDYRTTLIPDIILTFPVYYFSESLIIIKAGRYLQLYDSCLLISNLLQDIVTKVLRLFRPVSPRPTSLKMFK